MHLIDRIINYFKRILLRNGINTFPKYFEKIEELGGDVELRKQLSLNCYKRLGEDEMNADLQLGKLNKAMHGLVEKNKTV